MRFEAEHLDAGARGFVHDDAGTNHFGVVEHQQLPGRKHVAYLRETPLPDRPGAPHQQFRRAPFREGKFGDPLLGQLVTIIFDRYMPFHNFVLDRAAKLHFKYFIRIFATL